MDKLQPAAVLARAEQLISAQRRTDRREFMRTIGKLETAAEKAGDFGGIAHQEAVRAACENELHRRTKWLLGQLLQSHDAMSAPASENFRSACKDWIDKQIASDADDLQQFLIFNRVQHPEDLNFQSRPEIVSANAEIDNRFEQLQRNRIERALRWIVRWSRVAFTTIR